MKFVFVARAAPHKGLSDLLEASGSLRCGDWTLTVAGELAGPDRLAVEAADDNVRDRLTLLGPRPLSQIGAILRKHDALVVPSRYENFCNAALEGLACGLPVIGAALGGLRDMIVSGRNGLLFRPREIPALAAALAWAIDNQAAIRAMRAEARATAERYSWPVVAELTGDLFTATSRARERGDP